MSSMQESFNPRTHEECDQQISLTPDDVSSFNPRTHEECDKDAERKGIIEQLFQSTHSRGVRLWFLPVPMRPLRFQSTHSRGVRHVLVFNKITLFLVSIHALTRSATCGGNRTASRSVVSIHALTRSATRNVVNLFYVKRVSIHALTRSATVLDPIFGVAADVSIHALTRSATLQLIKYSTIQLFQSTHSRGVRLGISL